MTRREKQLWQVLRRRMKPYGDFVRVENVVEEGTPDVNYSLNEGRGEGWIELKEIDNWPKRADTDVTCPHYSVQQRLWHRRRARTGGRVFVLLRVNATEEIFLMRADWAAVHFGFVPQSTIRASPAVLMVEPGERWAEARRWLT